MQRGLPIGPWPLGIDNVSRDTSLRADPRSGRWLSLRDAVNVDVSREGAVSRRNGPRVFDPTPSLHSGWSHPSVGAFVVGNSVLYSVTPSGLTAVGNMDRDAACAFTVVNNEAYVTDGSEVYVVRAGLHKIGAPDAGRPTVTATLTGGLPAGRYGVAVACRVGDYEGGLSHSAYVVVPDGGGIAVTGLPSSDAVIYRTHPNGTAMYAAEFAPAAASAVYLVAADISNDPKPGTLYRMVGGSHIAYWRGRLLTAHLGTIRCSEPMDYGLYDIRTGFVQFSSAVTMLAPVDAGVFVGFGDRLAFLRGAKPGDWSVEDVGAKPPIPCSPAYVTGDELDPDLGMQGQECAVWLSESGYTIGAPNGTVVEVTADRLRVPGASRACIVSHGRRVTAFVQ